MRQTHSQHESYQCGWMYFQSIININSIPIKTVSDKTYAECRIYITFLSVLLANFENCWHRNGQLLQYFDCYTGAIRKSIRSDLSLGCSSSILVIYISHWRAPKTGVWRRTILMGIEMNLFAEIVGVGETQLRWMKQDTIRHVCVCMRMVYLFIFFFFFFFWFE